MTRQAIPSARRATLAMFLLAGALGAALLSNRPAAGQDTKKAAAAGSAKAAAVDDKVILPFVGENTSIVGRLDLARVDTPAFEQYVNKSVDDMAAVMAVPPEMMKEMKTAAAAGVKELREGLDAFREAGGNHVYLLMEGELFGRDGPVLVAPVGPGADKAKLTELFAKMSGGGSREIVGEVGNAVVLGTQGQIDALTQRVEVNRAAAAAAPPDLAKAFAAAGDAPFRVAFVPGEAARKLMAASLPPLPEEIGGGGPEVFTEGVRWATLSAVQKPAAGMTVTVQAADAEAAKRLMDVLDKTMALAKAQPAPTQDAESWTKLLDSVKPKQQGETTITVAVDPAFFQLLFGLRASAMGGGPPVAQPPPAKPDDGGL